MELETEKQDASVTTEAPVINEEEELKTDSPSVFFDYVWKPAEEEEEKNNNSGSVGAGPYSGSLAKHLMSPVWMTYDVLVGAVAIFMGFSFSPVFTISAPLGNEIAYMFLACMTFGLTIVISGFILGIYEKIAFTSRVEIVAFTGSAIVLAVALTELFLALLLFEPLGRWILLIAFLFSFPSLLIPRLMVHDFSLKNKLRIAIIGDINGAINIYNSLTQGRERFIYEVVGIGVTEEMDEEKIKTMSSSIRESGLLSESSGNFEGKIPLVTSFSDFSLIAENSSLDKIIVSKKHRNDLKYFSDIMRFFSEGVRIMSWSSFNEAILRRVVVEDLAPNWFYSANLNINNPVLLSIKRAIDVFISSLGLLISLPVMGIVACLIKLTSKGPVFYKQVRTGKFGRPFLMYKFRTMVLDSDKNGPTWATQNDERFTPMGGLLRKSRLDELPQLWNIFKGDMSFVGTRPIRPEVVKELIKQIPYFDMRHLAAPGLTGFAQVTYKYGASVEDQRIKLQYDLYYIKNFSILLDLQIILRTFSAMMKGAQ